MTGTQKMRSDETRRRILDAAAAAFARAGFDGTSLNDVIRGSGLTKGAFYFHFSSKEVLALAVIDDLREQWSSTVAGAIDLDKPAREQARDIAVAVAEAYGRNRSFRAIGRLVTDLMVRRSDLAPELNASLYLWIDFIEATVLRGQAEGTIRSDLNARLLAETIFAAFNGTEEFSELVSGGTDLRDRVDSLMMLIDQGIAAERPPQGEEHR